MARRDQWENTADGPLRTVLEAFLIEISLVGQPAYTQATASVASGPDFGRSVAPTEPPMATVVDLAAAGRRLEAREARMRWERLMDWRSRIVEWDRQSARRP